MARNITKTIKRPTLDIHHREEAMFFIVFLVSHVEYYQQYYTINKHAIARQIKDNVEFWR